MTAGGSYTVVNLKEEFFFPYYVSGMTEAEMDNVLVYFTQKNTAPPPLASQVIMQQETIHQ
jgi:hypothetical protein